LKDDLAELLCGVVVVGAIVLAMTATLGIAACFAWFGFFAAIMVLQRMRRRRQVSTLAARVGTTNAVVTDVRGQAGPRSRACGARRSGSLATIAHVWHMTSSDDCGERRGRYGARVPSW
jgi:hypothetical protein